MDYRAGSRQEEYRLRRAKGARGGSVPSDLQEWASAYLFSLERVISWVKSGSEGEFGMVRRKKAEGFDSLAACRRAHEGAAGTQCLQQASGIEGFGE